MGMETVTLVASISPIKMPVITPLIAEGFLCSFIMDASASKPNKVSRLS